MTEQELIDRLLTVLPNMTLGEDNDGQLIIYTDMRTENGEVHNFDGERCDWCCNPTSNGAGHFQEEMGYDHPQGEDRICTACFDEWKGKQA